MIKLMAMVKKYDGGICASPDGIEGAIHIILDGIADEG
jgi:hypothetical protein